jgi:hypothetical protein
MQQKLLVKRPMAGVAVLGLSLLAASSLVAGTYSSDFNSGVPPAGMTLYGNAWDYDHSTGGKTGGALKLTITNASQVGSASIDDFDNGATIAGFDATFQLYIGSGNGADGMCFCFGDFYDTPWNEEGPTTIKGLTVTFDVYNNGGTPAEAPAIDVKWDNVTVYHRLVGATAANSPAAPIGSMTTLRTQTTAGGAPVYVPVKIHVDTDGTLDVVYNNVVVITNLPVFRAMTDAPQYGPAYRFGFGARTGGSYDNHWVDDLSITTYPVDANAGQPYISSISPVPVGGNAGAAGGVSVEFKDSTYAIIPGTIKMNYTNTTVTPTITQDAGLTRVFYRGSSAGVLPTGGTTVTVSYATTGGFTNSFSWAFVVDTYTTVTTNFGVASVDTSKPGFKVRLHQMDWVRVPGDSRGRIVLAERQLARGYIDPTTGEPFDNLADLSLADADGYFSIPDVINFNYLAPAAAGNFSVSSTPARDDQLFPGIPGVLGSSEQFIAEFTTIVQLKAGGHRFGVNSDDGFKVTGGSAWDVTGGQLAIYDTTRGAADTLFDVVVNEDGFYPIRLLYVQGTGGSSLELFYYDVNTGTKVLVNDPENLMAPRAYQASDVMRPFVSRVLPVQNYVGAFPDQDLVVDITEDGLPLTAGSIVLLINNTNQIITTTKTGKVTTITRKGSMDNLLPSGLNTVKVIYSYSQGGSPVGYTNTYSFTVAPYYDVLQPGAKATSGVVTSDLGFRGRVDQIDKSGDANQGNGARINGGGDSNRMPWPEVQLIGGNINPTNGLRYPNLAATSPSGDFNYEFDFVNWNMASGGVVSSGGLFQTAQPASPAPGANADTVFPGLPGSGTSYSGIENYVNEIQTYLELKKGVYVFGFNSDDGFIARCAPNPSDTLGSLVGFYNGGRGMSSNPTGTSPVGQNPPIISPNVSSGSTLFSVIVPEDGIYPFRILYVQGGTGIGAEFYMLDRNTGNVLLIGDTSSTSYGIPAYRTYNGPAKPYVKFSISPNPWDNAVQQVGPGPITMVGRTRNAVNSSDIYNVQSTSYPNVRPWADVAIGAVIGNGASDSTIALLVDDVVVPATKTVNGTDVKVSWKPEPPLASGSTHKASLVYAGTTNSWTFTVQSYTNLNEADALSLSAADQTARGFRVKAAQTAAVTGYTASTMARAEAQLAGILGPNVAIPGTGPDGSYILTNIINWNGNFQTNAGTPLGNFQPAGYYGAGLGWPYANYAEDPIPGLPGTGLNTLNYSAHEVFAYLAFPSAGYYKLGVNSDDAFGIMVGTPGVTNGTAIASYDLGKGASDVPFSFMVPKAGLYPIRLVYYNSTGAAALEYFSYDENGNKIPINDWSNQNSIKAYYAVVAESRPNITSATTSAGAITVIWVNGGTLESAPTLEGPWTSTGDSDGSFTEPTLGTAKFYRVKK